jgi:hypothetical protein
MARVGQWPAPPSRLVGARLRAAPRAKRDAAARTILGYQACNLLIVGGRTNGREALELPGSTA